MSERVTYKRLLRQFAAIGPYLREDLCEEGRYRFDCLSVCVSAKPAPDKREFWGWWLVLEQQDHSFSYHYQVGFYNAEGEWLNKPLPKKHQAEVERTSTTSTSSSVTSCTSLVASSLPPSRSPTS